MNIAEHLRAEQARAERIGADLATIAESRALFRLSRKGTMSTDTECPVCGKQSVYSAELNRYFHADGSDSSSCWAKLRDELNGHHEQ